MCMCICTFITCVHVCVGKWLLCQPVQSFTVSAETRLLPDSIFWIQWSIIVSYMYMLLCSHCARTHAHTLANTYTYTHAHIHKHASQYYMKKTVSFCTCTHSKSFNYKILLGRLHIVWKSTWQNHMFCQSLLFLSILQVFDGRIDFQQQYQFVFCLWMLTFNEKVVNRIKEWVHAFCLHCYHAILNHSNLKLFNT